MSWTLKYCSCDVKLISSTQTHMRLTRNKCVWFVPHDQRNRLSGLLQHVDYMFNTHGFPSWVQQYKKQQRQHKRKFGQQKLDNKYWSDTGINVQLKLLNTCMSVCFVLFFFRKQWNKKYNTSTHFSCNSYRAAKKILMIKTTTSFEKRR